MTEFEPPGSLDQMSSAKKKRPPEGERFFLVNLTTTQVETLLDSMTDLDPALKALERYN